jgi:hypothetical protein
MLSQTVEPECRQRPAAIVSEIAGRQSRLTATFGSTMAPIAEAPDLTHWVSSTAVSQRGC